MTDWDLTRVPAGEYYLQVLWDQDLRESRINAPRNIYCEKKIVINQSLNIDLIFNKTIAPRKHEAHHLVRYVDFISDTLSGWRNQPMHLKTSILLPYSYEDSSDHVYPM